MTQEYLVGLEESQEQNFLQQAKRKGSNRSATKPIDRTRFC